MKSIILTALTIQLICSGSINGVQGKVCLSQNTLTCEHDQLTIQCPKNSVIRILSANYGRTRADVCTRGPIRNTSCSSSNSLSIVTTACDGKNSCKISARNNEFGDPCPNTYKYLDVSYCCEENEPKQCQLSTVRDATVCENQNLHISCPKGSLINIIDANYGRQRRDVCTNGTIQDVHCTACNSIPIVSTYCNAKESCVVPASSSLFGDPCSGTYKVLDVSYYCEVKKQSCYGAATQSSVACEDKDLSITCPAETTVNILGASYGRTRTDICTSPNIRTTNCHASDSLTIVANKCNKQFSCSVSASNSVFGDPCQNTNKYLDISYCCQPCRRNYDGRLKWIVICGDYTKNLVCQTGKLRIVYASFGRTTTEICPQTGNMPDLSCYSTNATKIITDWCEGKSVCSIFADWHVFGDPCYGTYKYLDIIYYCEEEDQNGNVLPAPIPSVSSPPGPNGNQYVKAYTGISCGGEAQTISCPKGTISVSYANVGRTTVDICPRDGLMGDINCYAPNSTNIVKADCNGKTSCYLSANWNAHGDHCVGTFKYLEVIYFCEECPPTTS